MRKYLNLLAAFVVTLTAASCSRTHYNVADLMPADAENAAVFNVAEMAQTAGVGYARDGSLNFPADFVASLSSQTARELEAANNALRQSGIALGTVGIYKPNDEEFPVYVLNLSNYDRFVKYITDKGYHRALGQLGIQTYTHPERPEKLLATKGDAVLVIDISGKDYGADNAWRYFINVQGNHLSDQNAGCPLSKGSPADIDKLPNGFRTILSVSAPTPQDILLFVKDLISLI